MQTFTIAPAGVRTMWVLVWILAPVFVIVTAAVAAAARGAQYSQFDVTPDGLRISGDFYGRFIPAGELRAADARRVDLNSAPELQPLWQTVGTWLPGYRAGWYRLRNGEKALLYLTDRTHAVYVPTTRGYSVIMSPVDPDGLVSALRRMNRS